MNGKTKSKLSLQDFKSHFGTDDQCRAYLEHAIWGNTPHCRHCGSVKVTRLAGTATRPGLFQCNENGCKKQFTVTVGTVFHDTHLPLTKWFLAIYLITETSKGVSANWLKDAIGVTYKTAWYLGHRIRRMLDAENTLLTGIVELDETYVGGKPRRGDQPAKRGRGTKKHAVFVAVQRGGEVRATTMDDLKFATMKPHLDKWLAGDAMLMTDEFKAYDGIGKFWKYHFRVQHGAQEFARDGGVHVNTAESFNATLKRAHTGVYHYMSAKHLLRYVSEVVFRWNGRGQTTLDRLAGALRNGVKRRLPYSVLIT
jgi:transposase-like protein